MSMYPKIDGPYKRGQDGKIIRGEWRRPEFLALLDVVWKWTEKIDGTNIRLWREGDRLVIGGRTERASIPVPLLDMLHATIDPAAIPEGAVVYGEGFGWKIQKVGPLYGPDPRFAVFDVRIGRVWLEPHNVGDVARKIGAEQAPFVGYGSLREAIDHVELARRRSVLGDCEAEGLVCRPCCGLLDRQGHRIIVKLKSKDLYRGGE